MTETAKRVRTLVAAALAIGLGVVLYVYWPALAPRRETPWTEDEITTLRSLWIGSLPALPPDPSNAFGDDPRAAELGQRLYFDARFSANGHVSCSTCHQPESLFTDGLPRSRGIEALDRNAPTIIGTAYSPWFFWDGRTDGQWAQALSAMEDPREHGGTRTQYAHLIHQHYREAYEAIFGPLPDLSDRSRFPDSAGPRVDVPAARAAWEGMTPEDRALVTRVYVNIGKAVAAYERLLLPAPARFDDYVAALLEGDTSAMTAAMTKQEVAGARLFIGEAQCTRCHNGPLFTNNEFHNTGAPEVEGIPFDDGRETGVRQVMASEFNCLSAYSDADESNCAELLFAKEHGDELTKAYKTPTLRLVGKTGPYMHAGQLATLREVLDHYSRAPAATVGRSELIALDLSTEELLQLEAFLHALTGPLAVSADRLAPPIEQ